MVYTKEYKETVKLDYACYICKSILSKPAQVIQHVERIHGYRLPRRHVGHRRPADPNYHFVSEGDMEEAEISHYACASCWFHCPETGIAELADHVMKEHAPQYVNGVKPRRNVKQQEKDRPDGQKVIDPEVHRELINKISEVADLLKGLVVKKQA
ncbi:hypothetical protein EDC96DRAFT_523419 [Choanephora cucurbitarum]|nr:hypothetical protein EDC96DRAFT_523419 [Choanephora cucurbitarum]